jgi:hypothetical protein
MGSDEPDETVGFENLEEALGFFHEPCSPTDPV